MTHRPATLMSRLCQMVPAPKVNWTPSAEELAAVASDLQAALEMVRSQTLDLVYQVNLSDHFEYEEDGTDSQWERLWNWIEKAAYFRHVGNGSEPGVWEFDVHVESHATRNPEPIPEELKTFFDDAASIGCTRICFYQF